MKEEEDMIDSRAPLLSVFPHIFCVDVVDGETPLLSLSLSLCSLCYLFVYFFVLYILEQRSD